MNTRTLGPFTVSAIGLGAMPFSMGNNERPDLERAIATVHAALDAGAPPSTPPTSTPLPGTWLGNAVPGKEAASVKVFGQAAAYWEALGAAVETRASSRGSSAHTEDATRTG